MKNIKNITDKEWEECMSQELSKQNINIPNSERINFIDIKLEKKKR